MTPVVNRCPFGAWTWEVVDEDGSTYLRSMENFADEGTALLDLKSHTHLIHPYIQFR